MPPRPKENVWNYPRPPALQPTSARLRVIWVTPSKQELVIAETTQGYRVLETSHPPTYYFPPSSVRTDLIKPSKARRTMCEWKGMALYHDVQFSKEQGPVVQGRIWSYPDPTPSFAKIKDYLCFYASSQTDPERLGRWKCMVDDDEVAAQEGDFYGSWITPEITGGDRGFKGGKWNPSQLSTITAPLDEGGMPRNEQSLSRSVVHQMAKEPSSSSGHRDPTAAYKGLNFAETLEDLSSRFIVNLPSDELSSIERICFQVEQAHWFYEDFLRPLNPSLPSLGLRRFSSFLLHTAAMTVPLIQRYITGGSGQQDLEAAFDDFLKYKTRVPVCGAILLAEDWNKCLLVKGWKSSAAWGFPKGKINQNEPERDCAIREVLEETGYDCSPLLPEDSQDYLDLTMREQKIRLYIVPGVKESTKFETLTRKEISKIAWFKLSDLPTWKKSKDPPPGMGGKFYLISPFIGRLKQWIHSNKHTHANRPRSKPDLDTSSASAAPSSPAPSKANASSATAPVPSFVDGSSLFPSFSGDAKTAPSKAAPLPAPPSSEKLKALLGLSSPTPEPSAPHPASSTAAFENMFPGVGAKMIQASSDERSQQLLSLLMDSHGSQWPGVSNAPAATDQQAKAALLLATLNNDHSNGQTNQPPAQTPNTGPQALLDMLNAGARSQSPLPAPIPQKTGQAQKLLQMISAGAGHDRTLSQSSFPSMDGSPAPISYGQQLPSEHHQMQHQQGPSQSDALLRMLQPSSPPQNHGTAANSAPENDLLSILTAGLPGPRPSGNDESHSSQRHPPPQQHQAFPPNASFAFPPHPPPHFLTLQGMMPFGGPAHPYPQHQQHYGGQHQSPSQGPPLHQAYASINPGFPPYSNGPPS